MSGIRLVAVLAGLGVATYVLIGSIYTVSEVEQAVVTQFGEPVGAPVTTAGLKFKVPFIQDVNLIDKRVLEWDGNPSDMPTKDKLYVSVDLFQAADGSFFHTTLRTQGTVRESADCVRCYVAEYRLIRAHDAARRSSLNLINPVVERDIFRSAPLTRNRKQQSQIVTACSDQHKGMPDRILKS